MLSPEKVKEIAPKYKAENLNFRSFLKGRVDSDELDRQFLKLHNELFIGYDCCSCTNCCKAYNICFNDEDILRAAEYLNMGEQEFRSRYLIESEDGYIIEPPCTFLEEDGRCLIQSCKPYECVGFPYTDKPKRLSCLFSVMDFAGCCPIVFEIVQNLKKIYHFKSRLS